MALTQQAAGLKHGWRSGLEERVGAQLDRLGVPFTFETVKVAYKVPERAAKYTPDFHVTCRTGKQIFVETKGRFMADDRKKHELIRAQRPDLDIRFVFQNPNARLSKVSKTTYAMWCDERGFLWAKALVPVAWLEE